MAEGWHPQYLSKGKGLPRRLDTTASQCWDARRDTLFCVACRTCSSPVSCSLERSTLTISGTCGGHAVRPAPSGTSGGTRSGPRPRGPRGACAGGEAPWASVCGTEVSRPHGPLRPGRHRGCPLLPHSCPRGRGEADQWAGDGRGDTGSPPDTRAGLGREGCSLRRGSQVHLQMPQLGRRGAGAGRARLQDIPQPGRSLHEGRQAAQPDGPVWLMLGPFALNGSWPSVAAPLPWLSGWNIPQSKEDTGGSATGTRTPGWAAGRLPSMRPQLPQPREEVPLLPSSVPLLPGLVNTGTRLSQPSSRVH